MTAAADFIAVLAPRKTSQPVAAASSRGATDGRRTCHRFSLSMAGALAGGALTLAGCTTMPMPGPGAPPVPPDQLPLASSFPNGRLPAGKPFITRDGKVVAKPAAASAAAPKAFKDRNANGKVDPYEDDELPLDARIANLVSLMSDEEKAGMLMINDNNAGCEGRITPRAIDLVDQQKMTRFILRSTARARSESCAAAPANARGGYVVTPLQLAQYTNGVQAMAEATRLGIPVVFKDNARNHVETDPRQGISAGAGAFTQFPKEAGLAAVILGEEARQPGSGMQVIDTFTSVVKPEYKAVGIRGLYGYMADLLTEPRWYRTHETFTEDSALNARIAKALVEGLQGRTVKDGTSVDTASVAMTMKHFPGGGPQELGMDPHYSFGKYQQYDGSTNFGYHLAPFEAAIAAGVSSIMPYYGIPMTGRDASRKPLPLTYEGVSFPLTGFAFSSSIVDDLLRTKLGFKGYVNSDTGIVARTPWGMEWKSEQQRIATAVNAGNDTLSGYNDNKTIKDLIEQGLISKARLDQAVARLLKEQFQLGLFENAYVDANAAAAIVGKADSVAKAEEVQKKSVVLLQNQARSGDAGKKLLPLAAGAKVYTIGFGKADVEKYGYTVTDGNYDSGKNPQRASAANHDVAIIRVLIKDKVMPFDCTQFATVHAGSPMNPLTGLGWGAEDPKIMAPVGATNPVTGEKGPAINAQCTLASLGNALVFGGVPPWEIGDISFSGMAALESRTMYPTLADIKQIGEEIGGMNKVVLSIYFRAPYVMDVASGLRNAGAIVATFGVNDKALLEVLSGRFKPQGKLPFALPSSTEAVARNKSDAPGYRETTGGELFPYSHGLTYP